MFMNVIRPALLLVLLAPMMALGGEYALTVDRVMIDVGSFQKPGIGYNGASPGPVLRFKEVHRGIPG